MYESITKQAIDYIHRHETYYWKKFQRGRNAKILSRKRGGGAAQMEKKSGKNGTNRKKSGEN